MSGVFATQVTKGVVTKMATISVARSLSYDMRTGQMAEKVLQIARVLFHDRTYFAKLIRWPKVDGLTNLCPGSQ